MSVEAQSCPIDYRYSAEGFRDMPAMTADVAYVIGGLYGNVEALHAILAMRAEEAEQGRDVALIFNGDFNWFNIDRSSLQLINTEVLKHRAIRGNVEAELARDSEEVDCGCNYPPYVDPGVIERSNEIFARLKHAALEFPEIRKALAALPKALVLEVGAQRVGIVHGDSESLAGWSFSAEAIEHLDAAGPPMEAASTPLETIEHFFRAADVAAFACSHTCLAYARDFMIDGNPRLIINNGSAGMPNFANNRAGVLTRIATGERPVESLYGYALQGVRFDALPIPYDHEAWAARFLENWPAGSPAFESYYSRIVDGPGYALESAKRGHVR